MPTRTLRKIQRNYLVAIPPALRRTFALHEGDLVEIEQDNNTIVIRPVEIRRKAALERVEAAMAEPVADPLACLSEEAILEKVGQEVRQSRGERKNPARPG